MQLLKSLVIGMGVLILVGLALLAYGIVQKTRDPGSRLFAPPPAAPAPPAATGPAPAARAFGDVNLRLPEGCAIETVLPDGDRLYLTIGPTGPCARVVVVDVARGRVLGTVKTGP
ncbi:MAG: hypothetical protein ACE5GT_06080 [Rhodospirillales bacterium]